MLWLGNVFAQYGYPTPLLSMGPSSGLVTTTIGGQVLVVTVGSQLVTTTIGGQPVTSTMAVTSTLSTITTQTVTYTPATTPPPPVQLTVALNKQVLNSGETLGGIVYSNRASTVVDVHSRRRDPAYGWQHALSGITNAQGQYVAAMVVDTPGIYEVKATMLGVDSNAPVVTVVCLKVSVNPDQMARGSLATVEVFSDLPNAALEVWYSPNNWATTQKASVTTDNSGRAVWIVTVNSAGSWQFKAYNPATGQFSVNIEWLTVT